MGLILQQYNIVIVNLDPTIGSEIKKTRPCIIVSPDEMNDHLKTIIIAPVTSKSRNYPTRVMIMIDHKKNWVVLDQIRTVDKRRILKNIGTLATKEIKSLKAVIKEMLVD